MLTTTAIQGFIAYFYRSSIFRILCCTLLISAITYLPAQAQCTVCDVELTLSGNSSASLSATADNQTICLKGAGTYNGAINGNNRNNLTICIAPGVTFSSSASVNNATNGASFNNHGTFQPNGITLQTGRSITNNTGATMTGGVTLNGGTINNAGTWTPSSFSVNSGTIINTGVATFSMSITGNSLTWSGAGSVAFNGGFSANNGSYDFGGTTSITGNFSLASGPSVSFNGSTSISGTLTVSSGATLNIANRISVGSNINNQGIITVPSTAPSCVSLCNSGGSFTNNGSITAASGKTMTLCRTPGGSGSRGTGVSVITAPTNQPTGFSATLDTNTGVISIVYNAANSNPAGYILLRKTSAFAASDNPVFGTSYSVGSTIGGATVVAMLGQGNGYFQDVLNSCGTFRYRVFSAASNPASCTNFNTTSPPTTGPLTYSSRSASFNYNATSFCQNATDPVITLSGTPSIVGTFSAAAGLNLNTSTGAIDLSESTPGTYTVTRTIPASNGCAQATATASVTVTAPPSATISYNDPFCTLNLLTYSPNRTGTGGGTYSSTFGLSISSDGTITPLFSLSGDYVVTYTIPASGGCGAFSTTTTVRIRFAQTATISYSAASYCSNASTQLPTITGITGGTFSASPSGLSINSTTGEINPSSSVNGTYTITYSLPANGGCPATTATTSVTIYSFTPVNISYATQNYCSNETAQNVNRTGAAGGVFSSTTGLNLDASTGAINPSLSQVGTYTINYTVIPVSGCNTVIASTTVTINPMPSATISYAVPAYCTSTPSADVNRTGTSGGTYSASPSGLMINASTGTIQPASSSVGKYTVSYTIAASGGCPAVVATTSVTIGWPSYSWSGGTSGDYAQASNWTPNRNITQVCDELIFNNGLTTQVNQFNSSQTIRRISISNNSTVSINSSQTRTLTVSNVGQNGVVIGSGSVLRINGNNLTLAIGTNTRTSVAGQIDLASGILDARNGTLSFDATSGAASPITRTNGTILTGSETTLIFGETMGSNQAAGAIPSGIFNQNPATVGQLIIGSTTSRISLGNQAIIISSRLEQRNNSTTELDLNGQSLTLNGEVIGNPRLNDRVGTGTLVLSGSQSLSGIRFTGARQIGNLQLNRTSADTVYLPQDGNLNVPGQITFNNGILKTGYNVIDLGNLGTLGTETDESNIVGYVRMNASLSNNQHYNLSNIGLEMTTGATVPGYTVITRNTLWPMGTNRTGVRRCFTINPTVNANLGVTIRFGCLQSELNGVVASTLAAFRSTNGGASWQRRGYSERNSNSRYIRLSNINSFSDWILSGDNVTLPVTLTAFWGHVKNDEAQLIWRTVAETNNAGFKVEFSSNGEQFTKVGFVTGSGQRNGSTYSFNYPMTGQSGYFRLVQVDHDGTESPSQSIFLNAKPEGMTNLALAPNPARGFTRLSYHTLNSINAAIMIRDAQGKVVSTANELLELGSGSVSLDLSKLPPGIYFCSVTTPDGQVMNERLVVE